MALEQFLEACSRRICDWCQSHPRVLQNEGRLKGALVHHVRPDQLTLCQADWLWKLRSRYGV